MPLVVVLALLLVPILEILVIVQVGQAIGAGPTILLLIGSAVLGAWLVRREGRRAWFRLRDRLNAGAVPAKELADGALILIGGTLLLTPGFLTDIVGFFLVLPFTRPLARGALVSFAGRAFLGAAQGSGQTPPPRSGRVIPGDVVDDDRP